MLEKLDLPDLFRRQDFRNDGYVTVDEFNRILKDARLSLDTGEFDMLKHSYTNARGEFDYKKFLDLVTDRIKTKRETEQQSKERLLRDFYNKIREKFNTVDEFFTKYDANGDRTIDKSEFIKIIKEFDQKMTSVEVVDLFNYLDPNTTGKIQPYSMNQVFKPFLEDEVKNVNTFPHILTTYCIFLVRSCKPSLTDSPKEIPTTTSSCTRSLSAVRS